MTYAPSVPSAAPINPIGYKSYVTGIVGVTATVVLPYLHSVWPWIPAVDESSVQMLLGAIVSFGIIFHRVGLANASMWVVHNVAPAVLPQLEAAVAGIIREELQRLQPQAASAGIDLNALGSAVTKLGAVIVAGPAFAPPNHDLVKISDSHYVAIPKST